MRKIAITVPELFIGEAEAITSLLTDGGFWRVHIRKPGASPEQITSLIATIPADLYPRLSLHDCFEVAEALGLGGVHLNGRNPLPPAGWKGLISRSLHSIDEITRYKYDYAFLSPIYPGISKPGYCGNFSLNDIKAAVNDRIFALGGVTPDKFDRIATLGFGGVAMLGSVWKKHVDTHRFRLQFITHATDMSVMLRQVEQTLAGGCRWIQLRHKDTDISMLMEEGRAIRRLCDRYGATFIIDDHVEIVEALNADGVHLGKNDMPVGQAREILGIRRIIGATANTFDDIAAAVKAGADYIGLGPYRFTATKAKLSPILGLDGYHGITSQCRKSDISLPIVAIGGIGQSDIAGIMSTGVDGVAVSGAIRNAPDPAVATAGIIDSINKSVKQI